MDSRISVVIIVPNIPINKSKPYEFKQSCTLSLQYLYMIDISMITKISEITVITRAATIPNTISGNNPQKYKEPIVIPAIILKTIIIKLIRRDSIIITSINSL